MGFFSLVFLACFLCSSLGVGSPSKSCDPNDLAALKEFLGQLIKGSVKFSWSNESSCCEWEGVVCRDFVNESAGRRVMALNLSGKGLKGELSESLCRLDLLERLDLSLNILSSGLPSCFSNLKQLGVLDLSYNILSGSPYMAISGLESVRFLNLATNLFNGNLADLGVFPNLVVFNISNNLFADEFSSKLCTFSYQIKVLDLSSNYFSGRLEGLENCDASLRELHLDSNKFSGDLPNSLYSLSLLEHLSISSNNFSGRLCYKISKLLNLRTLILTENRFSGSLPNVFGNLTELEQFVAPSNSFSGSLPNTLAHCSKLQVLDLRNNTLRGPILLDFSRMPNLCTLDLASNNFSGPLPDSLSSCQELRILNFANNYLTGQIPETYTNLSSLSFVSLSKNYLVNLRGSLSRLRHCRNLTTLVLTKNFRAEEMPGSMSGFESLLFLALGNCGLTGRIPDWLLNCRMLQVLDLSWNHLQGSIPSWIGQMEGLYYLDLSNNSLTGAIPIGLIELKSLVSVTHYSPSLNMSDGIPLFVKRNQSARGLQYSQASSFPPSILLSNNRINGLIWPGIGRLRQLHALDLSWNNLTGTIPSSISDMVNLEMLDLSSNALHGSIPLSFSLLTFLSRFSVANNDLVGPIPTGGQFLSFPSSSFDGNPGLCGQNISPCPVKDECQSPTQPRNAHGKFVRGCVFGITISIGTGIALILAFLLMRMSRRNDRVPIEDVKETSRAPRFSDAFGSPKLVFFKNTDCRDLTISDLLNSTNNFHQSNIIGCGGFGLVYKANLPNGSNVAIKRLSGDSGQMEREFQAEVEALSRAQHKNLVSLQGYCLYGNDRLLVYAYMENGSLDYWLHERVDESSLLAWETRLKIAQGAAHGLAYLHNESNIIHRDIKTSNILLNEKFEAHLADFGFSRLLHPYDTHVTTDLVGTLGYIPPEYSQTLTATFKGDIYSFGVVLLELITGRRPVDVCKGKDCRVLVPWIYQKKLEKKEKEIFDSSIWHKDCEKQLMEVLFVACKCIDEEPRRRLSIDEVVSLLDAIESGKT